MWNIRANPAQARRSRKATCGSSISLKASKRSPACCPVSNMGADKGIISNGGPPTTRSCAALCRHRGCCEENFQGNGNARSRGNRPDRNKFTFGQVQNQINVSCPDLNQAEHTANCSNLPGQDPIIKVMDGNIQVSIAEILGKGLDGRRKQERPQRVALLDPSLGLDNPISKLKPSGALIAPGRPTAQRREVLQNCKKKNMQNI